jgi:adsorption protein B
MFWIGVARWVAAGAEGALRIPGLIASDWAAAVFVFSALMQVFHMAIKAGCGARFYGWRFAAAAPLRTFAGNWINFAATLSALWRYGSARLRGRPLVWLKTEHLYPSREALSPRKPRLGEILVACEIVAQADIDEALERKPPGQRLGEYLVARGLVTEADLYEALATQQNLGIEPLSRARIAPAVTRTLPAALARKWKILPFRVAGGKLHIAGPEFPEPAMIGHLAAHTSLEIRFQLITPRAYQGFEDEFLSPAPSVEAPAAIGRARNARRLGAAL